MARRFSSWLVIFFLLGGCFPSIAARARQAQTVLPTYDGPQQQTALFYQWYSRAALHVARLCSGGAGGSVLDDPVVSRFISPELLGALHEAGRGDCTQKLSVVSAYFLHTNRVGCGQEMPSEVMPVVQTASRALVQVQVGKALLCVRLRHEHEGWRIFRIEPQGVPARATCIE
ncbi:MAG: hypothetical protein LKE96_02180 [Acetobacter peroxydans]|jgi:hypothetical protein|nr:hypothetical protein [Acetobacter peroxydans]